MSVKARLPKETIDAIETMRAKGARNEEIVQRHIQDDHIKVNGYKKVDDLLTDVLIRALYIGYEVEETPEDKVRNYYNDLQSQFPNSHAAQSADTVVIVLDLLNIKLKGVNA